MSITLIAGLLLAANPIISEDQAKEALYFCGERHIGWIGSAEDRRRIKTFPVPDQFKAIWKRAKRSCETFDRDSLLEWHLKFGTERSTIEAMDWMETKVLNDAVAIPPEALKKAWKAASTGTLSHGYALQHDDLDAYEFLAAEYLRAAEFFHSAELLSKAKPYVDAVNIGLDTFYPDTPVLLQSAASPAIDPNTVDYQLNEHRDLEVRYAVERAYQTGGESDINAAEQILERVPGGSSMMVSAAELAENTDDDYCKGNDGSSSADTLIQACKTESKLDERITQYWRNRAFLDQVIARTAVPSSYGRFGGGQTSLEIALYFLRHSLPTGNQPVRDMDSREADELVGLYLAAANTERLCDQTSRAAAQYGCNSTGDDYLAFAEELVSPVINPNRIRQIASAYASSCRQPGYSQSRPCRAGSEKGRLAEFMQVVVSHLDQFDDPVGSPPGATSTAMPRGLERSRRRGRRPQ